MAIAAGASPKDSVARDGEMTLIEHLLELRNRDAVLLGAVRESEAATDSAEVCEGVPVARDRLHALAFYLDRL
jgi:hypothetical protein